MKPAEIFNEKEIQTIFEPPKSSVKFQLGRLKTILKYLAILIVFFAFGYLFINLPTFGQKIKYFWKTEYKNQPVLPQAIESQINSPAFTPDSKPVQIGNQFITMEDNHLYVAKLDINVPIVWEVPSPEIMDKLEQGVVHVRGTGLPGQPGNVFIVGHSSYYWWSNNPYKRVFALLDKLVAGDKIVITFQKQKYIYEVYEKVVVKPNNVEVLNSTPNQIVSLMTCVPVGTNLNRLVVKAKQVSFTPTSQQTTPSTTSVPATTTSSLPLPSSLPALSPGGIFF